MLKAHTLTEARLYLKITACEKCEPRPKGVRKQTKEIDHSRCVKLNELCPSCGSARELEFAIEPPEATPDEGRPAPINFTQEPSQIIDVGQWLTLSQLFLQESSAERDRSRARLLSLQAAQCLDEALKFYDDPENDLPPSNAFYCNASHRRFRESPQQFSRTRLISEKRKLPVIFGEP